MIAGPLLLLIAVGLAKGAIGIRERTSRTVLLYLALSLAGLAAIAKEGAAQNYFLEPWLATILASALALRGFAARLPRWQPLWPAFLAVAAAVSNFSYPSLNVIPHALRHPEKAADLVTLSRLVHETPGPVLSENLSLLVLDHRPVLLEPFGIELISEHGHFHPDRLVRDCEAGRFPLVVVEWRIWEIPGFGECLERRYAAVAEIGPYEALRPRLPSGHP